MNAFKTISAAIVTGLMSVFGMIAFSDSSSDVQGSIAVLIIIVCGFNAVMLATDDNGGS